MLSLSFLFKLLNQVKFTESYQVQLKIKSPLQTNTFCLYTIPVTQKTVAPTQDIL